MDAFISAAMAADTLTEALFFDAYKAAGFRVVADEAKMQPEPAFLRFSELVNMWAWLDAARYLMPPEVAYNAHYTPGPGYKAMVLVFKPDHDGNFYAPAIAVGHGQHVETAMLIAAVIARKKLDIHPGPDHT